jgi:hypothetical protein
MAQRHNWPRKNEGVRIYRERCGAYFIIWPELRNGRGHYDAIVNVMTGSEPSLGNGSVSPEWLRDAGNTRVQWSEIPSDWQSALRYWLDHKPESYRGLWLIDNEPQTANKR